MIPIDHHLMGVEMYDVNAHIYHLRFITLNEFDCVVKSMRDIPH